MTWKRVITILAAGLVAGLVLLCGPWACRTAGDALVDAGDWLRDAGDAATSDADAQTSGEECRQWEWSTVYCSSRRLSEGDTCSVPEGWEPFSFDGGSGNTAVRRCVL